MLDFFVSLFPGWVPDQVVYGLAGVFLAGCLVIMFPPLVRRGVDDER